MIDAILSNTVLPRISQEYLKRLSTEQPFSRIALSVANDEFAFRFE